MSDITDWEPEMKPTLETFTESNWKEQYERQLRINELLISENQNFLKKLVDSENVLLRLQSDYTNYKKSAEQNHRCLKAEIVTSLKAIDLCLLASLRTNQQLLNHKARNFRMRHVHQIICNEIAVFGDRKLISYEDDF